ncbi:MAG TPA: hypothetical protein VFZ52_12290 [Chryseolinea sp.]
MRIYLLPYFALIVCTATVQAQQITPEADSLRFQKFLTMVNADREQSYVTFGSGIGNLEPLILEANFSPSYFFTRNKKLWAVMINPQVQIRILNEKSLPVRNPSYRVYGTFYQELKFWKNSFLGKIFYENALWHGSIAHHSNGQAGDFFENDSTGEINFSRGNFSTDFLEVGFSTYRARELGKNYFSFRSFKATFEYHPIAWYSDGLEDLYGSYRIFADMGVVGPQRNLDRAKLMKWLQRSSLEVKVGWIFGAMDGASPADVSTRLIIDVYYKYYPVWFDEIAFFLRYYRGQDYYNIQFANDELSNISFGITSNIMNFKEAVKFFR